MSWELGAVLGLFVGLSLSALALHVLANRLRRRDAERDELALRSPNVRVLPRRDPDDWGFGEWQ